MKKIVSIFSRFFILIICITGFSSLFSLLMSQENGIEALRSVIPIAIQGNVSVDGGPMHKLDESLWKNELKQSLVIEGHFNHSITNKNSLIIWPRNLKLKFYVNDTLVITTGEKSDFPNFIQYAGNSYKLYYLGNILNTDQIRFEIEKVYDSNLKQDVKSFLTHLYTGRRCEIFQDLLSKYCIHLVIGVFLILIGFFVLIELYLHSYKMIHPVRQFSYLGWLCIIGGTTYISDTCFEFMDLFFPVPVINTLTALICIPLLMLLYLLYINSMIHDSKGKTFSKWITAIFIALQVYPMVLQISGILDLYESRYFYLLLGSLCIFLSLGPIIYDIIKNKNYSLLKGFTAILPVVIGMMLKVCQLLFIPSMRGLYLVLGILISCFTLLVYTLKYVKQTLLLVEHQKKIKEEVQNAQIAIMLTQIHPHFLFNALNTLEHVCHKDGELAAEAIQHFSRYLRGNMDSLTNNHSILFEQELEHIKHYLYIEQLRFGEHVSIIYDLEVTDFFIPTLTLQPIVENAIRHGITKQVEGGVVQISTRKNKDEIWIVVTDNGVGFDITKLKDNDRSHIGISNVKKRLMLQCNGTLEIDSHIGTGTKVTIRLKEKGAHNIENNDC